MATSLRTANYGFGKYAPDDVTSYLTDYNGTMDKIDSAIKGVQDIADEAKATSDSNLNNIASITQGLTATNKNVENLGKTQTAQQTEIDNIKSDVNAISIGVLETVTFSATSQGETVTLHARNIGTSAVGSGSFYLAEKTLNSFTALGEEHLFDIGYRAGNVFNLANGVLSRGLAVCASGTPINTTFNAIFEIGLFYDVAANMTKFGLISKELTIQYPGGVCLGVFA